MVNIIFKRRSEFNYRYNLIRLVHYTVSKKRFMKADSSEKIMKIS